MLKHAKMDSTWNFTLRNRISVIVASSFGILRSQICILTQFALLPKFDFWPKIDPKVKKIDCKSPSNCKNRILRRKLALEMTCDTLFKHFSSFSKKLKSFWSKIALFSTFNFWPKIDEKVENPISNLLKSAKNEFYTSFHLYGRHMTHITRVVDTF